MKLLQLLLMSLKITNSFDSFDLALIIEPSFEEEVHEILEFLRIEAHIIFKVSQNVMDSSCLKYRIFEWPPTKFYKKVLYLDSDIIMGPHIETLWSLDLQGKIAAFPEHTIDNPCFGRQFFDFSK